jgi:hypothetical protein
MKIFKSHLGRLVAVGLALSPVTPVMAQDMGENGMAIPSFFFSGSERRAREACENRLPECRPAVRAQMSFERDISLFFPWIGLALAVLIALNLARKREIEKEKKRKLAQAHHVTGAYRKMGEDQQPREQSRSQEIDDRF